MLAPQRRVRRPVQTEVEHVYLPPIPKSRRLPAMAFVICGALVLAVGLTIFIGIRFKGSRDENETRALAQKASNEKAPPVTKYEDGPTTSGIGPMPVKLKRNPDVGKTRTVKDVSKDKGTVRFFAANGQAVSEIHPGHSETVYRATVLVADNEGTPTKYLCVYQKANETEGGKKNTFSYEGKALLYEKGKDGKCRVGVAGKGDLDPWDVEKLFEKVNRPSESDAILKQLDTTTPVKIGNIWKLDAKLLAEALGAELDEAKSTLTMKLSKVTVRGKTRVGTFELDQRLWLKTLRKTYEMTFDPPAEYSVNGTIEMAIDGTSTELSSRLSVHMKGNGKFVQFGQKGSVEFDFTSETATDVSAEVDEPAARKIPAVAWLAAPGEWVVLKPKDVPLTVEFPGTPKEAVETDARGNITTKWTTTTNMAVIYTVYVSDLTGAAKTGAKAILDGMAKNSKAEKVTEIKLDGHPGLEFQLEETKDGTTFEDYHRVVIVGDRLIQQCVIAAKGSLKPADLEKFMKSLKITEKAAK